MNNYTHRKSGGGGGNMSSSYQETYDEDGMMMMSSSVAGQQGHTINDEDDYDDDDDDDVDDNALLLYAQQLEGHDDNDVSGNMMMMDGDDDDANIGGPIIPEINFNDPTISSLPRVLLMGPRRGGKTSMLQVVFQKMSPHETLFRLEPTQRLGKELIDHTPLCRFTIWDFPGDSYGIDDDDEYADNNQIYDNYGNIISTGTSTTIQEAKVAGTSSTESISTFDQVFIGATSLIFVVDAQDEPYYHVLQSFTSTVTRALHVNPNIAIELFINKVDGELFLSDESKYDCRRDVMTQVTDDLTDAGVQLDSIQIRYHLTSIYDHSIYEAFSRVVQRLIPQLPTLENLLNVLVSTCSMEKAYLFDVISKLYVSTDSGPVDMQSVELCSDMIDVVLDVSGIYGLGPSNEAILAAANAAAIAAAKEESTITGEGDGMLTTTTTTADNIGLIIQNDGEQPEVQQEDMIDPDSAYDNESASVIRLSNGMVLYLKEVDTMLALVCITRQENFRKKSLVNYNIGRLKHALKAIVTGK